MFPSKRFFFFARSSPTGIVPCPATPTTFGHIRAANGQGQQRRRITSIQPPAGLQEWLRTFQVGGIFPIPFVPKEKPPFGSWSLTPSGATRKCFRYYGNRLQIISVATSKFYLQGKPRVGVIINPCSLSLLRDNCCRPSRASTSAEGAVACNWN